MSTLAEQLDWTGIPVPPALEGLDSSAKAAVAVYVKEVVDKKTDGLNELYHAIGMIVKYIPHFIVIPLMVEHIRPQIAAGVCITMGVDQAVHYANDLPVEYFSEVSKHLDDTLMGQIFEKMKRHHAEKVIQHELRNHLSHMLGIAAHLDGKLLQYIAKQVNLPDRTEELQNHPHRDIIEKLRTMQ